MTERPDTEVDRVAVRSLLQSRWLDGLTEDDAAEGNELLDWLVDDLADEADRAREPGAVLHIQLEDLDALRPAGGSVARLMALRNTLKAARGAAIYASDAWNEGMDSLTLLLAPIAPHLAEEIWQHRHPGPSVHVQPWPEWDAAATEEDIVTLVVQVNGKVRGKIEVPAGVDEAAARELALADPNVQRHLENKVIRKVIVAGGALVNIVV